MKRIVIGISLLSLAILAILTVLHLTVPDAPQKSGNVFNAGDTIPIASFKVGPFDEDVVIEQINFEMQKPEDEMQIADFNLYTVEADGSLKPINAD